MGCTVELKICSAVDIPLGQKNAFSDVYEQTINDLDGGLCNSHLIPSDRCCYLEHNSLIADFVQVPYVSFFFLSRQQSQAC